MEALITNLITWLATGIDIVTAIITGFAVLEAAIKIIMLYFAYLYKNSFVNFASHKNIDDAKERIRLSLGKWFSLSLEFALGADILRSTIAPTWDDIGKLAAIIALRTILNYFLSKENEQVANKNNAGSK